MATALKTMTVRGLDNALPALFTLLFILLARIPFHDSAAGPFVPLFSLIYAYYFRLHFPATAPLWLLFAFGLLEDFLSGGTLGLTSLLLLLVAALLERKRALFAQGTFFAEILTFTVFSISFAGAYWLVAGFVEARFLPGIPFLILAAATALAFPVFIWIFRRLFRQYAA